MEAIAGGRQGEATAVVERWVEVDRWGEALAGKMAAMDVEIGEWLLAAREAEVHRHLGYASFASYVERRVGLTAHAVAERLRVAESLRKLTGLRTALGEGSLSWSAVREVTRVAVPETEQEWLLTAEGQSARDIQQKVSGLEPGQRPSERPSASLHRRRLHVELEPEQYAMFQEAMRDLQHRTGTRLTEAQALLEMARAVLVGPGDEGRSPYQVALCRCEDCGRTFQDARGEQVELPPEVVDKAMCDAQHIGSVDGSSPVGRAVQDIPPAVRRRVMRRDHGRCRAPGCRNTVWVEVHHLHMRIEGGDHDPRNLAALCSTHHQAIHAGSLLVRGDANAKLEFFHADGAPYGGHVDAATVAVMRSTHDALRHMGFRETETKQALARVRPGQDLEMTLREALRLLTDDVGARA